MKVTIIRHGIAVASGTGGIPDDERPLTRKGRRRFRRAARGLVHICPTPDALLTSPLPRAAETAGIAAAAWGGITPIDEPILAHGSLDDVLALLDKFPTEKRVALVGHEPTVSALVARLVGSDDADRFAFRKGGVAHVHLPGRAAEGGRLEWFLRPRILRALG